MKLNSEASEKRNASCINYITVQLCGCLRTLGSLSIEEVVVQEESVFWTQSGPFCCSTWIGKCLFWWIWFDPITITNLVWLQVLCWQLKLLLTTWRKCQDLSRPQRKLPRYLIRSCHFLAFYRINLQCAKCTWEKLKVFHTCRQPRNIIIIMFCHFSYSVIFWKHVQFQKLLVFMG